MADNLALYLFKQGTNNRAYEYMGAHKNEDGSYTFRVWAPNAHAVYLCGDFNGWKADIPMTDIGGVWEIEYSHPELADGARYKYIIERDGVMRYKADPYGYYAETLANTASRIFDIEGFKWKDRSYLKYRKEKFSCLAKNETPEVPMNIYEVHLGSWQRDDNGDYLNYRELADRLSAYVKRMGYTHIELMPVAEHPFDGSWGYQGCGYYAPTSRFGTPHDFMYFVNKMHSVGIGVIMDWVPAHFPKDAHGLYEFDGGPLYEYQGWDRKEHKQWGTRCFDVARNEVSCFLISNVMFWAEKYHIDGFRVDAVSSMLYLDYGRDAGEWSPNPDGSNLNIQTIAFFKKLNGEMKGNYPDIMMIAEEATSYHGITHGDGLGFSFKWNMGWMNDTLKYAEADPIYRKDLHTKMNFSLMYAYKERYILPISHDEVVHGKKSLVDKMTGNYHNKFATARTYLGYMMTHPGKKLLFMGCEFAQFREWDYENSLEWFMLDYDMHARYQRYVSELNALYLNEKALWQQDGSPLGFEWIDADRNNDNTYLYRRYAKDGSYLTVVTNFAPVEREYVIPVKEKGVYSEIFNSDNTNYGGGGCINYGLLSTVDYGLGPCIKIKIPPSGFTVIKKFEGNDEE
ncbi:MAG: 1,4-alpha-glucan branching protein GlgB [Clostridia bacterium]|nr:1,4-alpha-glucan branching protein GlgB [Clostridia bacterium]MBQ7048573.1 1,4-alpha-glucan branching protein GlgB [Clostridia bacterium]